jgi:hypothetical protein
MSPKFKNPPEKAKKKRHFSDIKIWDILRIKPRQAPGGAPTPAHVRQQEE